MQAVETTPPQITRWLYEDIANMYLQRNQSGDREAALGYLTKARDVAAEMGAGFCEQCVSFRSSGQQRRGPGGESGDDQNESFHCGGRG